MFLIGFALLGWAFLLWAWGESGRYESRAVWNVRPRVEPWAVLESQAGVLRIRVTRPPTGRDLAGLAADSLPGGSSRSGFGWAWAPALGRPEGQLEVGWWLPACGYPVLCGLGGLMAGRWGKRKARPARDRSRC